MLPLKGSCRLFLLFLILAITSAIGSLKAQNNLIVTGDFWAYWDLGFEPDPAWAHPNYEDFDWSYGPSPLGFGEPYIVTQLQPFITTAYFRYYFYTDPIPAGPVTLRVRRDDGVILYLNGGEIFRNNMPQGPVDYSTPASSDIEAVSYLETIVDPSLFVPGYNLMAAEVHQYDLESDDLVFDLQLQDTNPPTTRIVIITSPADNTTVGPGSEVRITATAGPAEEVVSVAFYEGANLLATDSQAPYETVWASPPPSNYVLRAVATYTDALTKTSTPVSLTVASSVRVVRGPYLQTGTPTSLIVKWRTDFASDSVVWYGASPDNLDRGVRVNALTAEHEVPLTGLSPDTKYYYSIGASTTTHAGGPNYFFVTSPAGPKPTRIWVIGDSGTGSAQARNVWLSYSNYTRGRYTDAWLMLGDNAYNSGTDAEYQRGMFDMYPDILRQTVVWPTIGNHEVSPAYFDIFSLPRNGEAGGVPSGVENYYSFDYGSIHFICLGGYYSGSRLSNGLMCTWLKADLEANTNKWLIAYWHQPPYTRGSHNSDFEHDLVEMRENAVPILESYGVDLVLSGHSHCYERSYLMRGHYGYSSSLEPEMLLNTGSGRIDDTGPYVKQTEGAAAHHGTVYVVAGSSGWATYGSLDHPVMYTSYLRMGSLVLDIDGDTLNATFLRDNGDIDDYFTIVKGDTAVRILGVNLDEGTATLSWTSTPGRHYQLQFTSNLASGWTSVGDVIQATGPVTGTGHVTGGAPQGFYRVLQID